MQDMLRYVLQRGRLRCKTYAENFRDAAGSDVSCQLVSDLGGVENALEVASAEAGHLGSAGVRADHGGEVRSLVPGLVLEDLLRNPARVAW